MRFSLRNQRVKRGSILLIASVFLIIIFFRILSSFDVTTIDVDPKSVSVVIDRSQLSLNLLFFPDERLRQILLNDYPVVKQVEFTKVFPHTLQIHLILREPIAYFVNNNRKLAVDEGGNLFRLEKEIPLPIVEIPVEEMVQGNVVKGVGVNTILAFMKNLSHDEPIERIVLSNDRTLEVQLSGLKVLLLSDADGQKEADTLQTLLKGFRMKGSIPQVIDLRFSKAIITP